MYMQCYHKVATPFKFQTGEIFTKKCFQDNNYNIMCLNCECNLIIVTGDIFGTQ